MPQLRKPSKVRDTDPLWYKDAIIYEMHVRAFCDSDGDGIGDFKGLTTKLDYLKELGVTAIWLLPFFPSPLKDDGYDTADYTGVHDTYGTLPDFKRFLKAAHKRGLKVITELVLNHTSDRHPWFQRARTAKPGSKWRNFYVWSTTAKKYEEARIIFKDFETSNWTWDPTAQAYYWHRFYSHQPDLNFDNPQVIKVMFRVLDFWFKMGVDGLRLDAVPYLFEREGTNCENLPETYDLLRELRAHVDANHTGKMLLAEANQWPEDSAAYFGDGDLCHMAFHFPIMPRLYMALHMEDRYPLLDILEQTPDIPETSQWALFLRNHDELTLEMVTDEERDYMYRVYAGDPRMRINLGIRRRFAPLMGNNRRTMELLNALLLSLPGTPVLYYGDEIGMGDNIYLGDRNAVRTPMQWSADRNAGFSDANPQQLFLPTIIDPEYHYQTVNVEAQESNPHSLLWWMRRIISLRKRFKAFGRGKIHFLTPENRKILVFVRTWEEETILVVANLSRYVQFAEIDLSQFAGMVPVELFGRTDFPPIGLMPYTLTMGPHSFFWFSLNAVTSALETSDPAHAEPPVLTSPGGWPEIMTEATRAELESVLPRYLTRCLWFNGRGRRIKSVHVQEALTVSGVTPQAYITLVDVHYVGGDQETYALPLAYAGPGDADRVLRDSPKAAVARLRLTEPRELGLLYDALADQGFCRAILETVPRRSQMQGAEGRLMTSRTRAFTKVAKVHDFTQHAALARVDRNNTLVVFGDIFALKFFRRLEPGVNPELEIGRFLDDRKFEHVAQTIGAIEYRRERHTPITLAVLQSYIPSEDDAWTYTQDVLQGFLEELRLHPEPPPKANGQHLLDTLGKQPPSKIRAHFGSYLEQMGILGTRTAQMHRALASVPPGSKDDDAFRPESFTRLYQRSVYQGCRSRVGRVLPLLAKAMDKLPQSTQLEAQWVMDHKAQCQDFYKGLLDDRLSCKRIRCHGDYALVQALLSRRDFAIIDFEGDASRPLSERRIKRSCLRDMAGLIRSLHYAGFAALSSAYEHGLCLEDSMDDLRAWCRSWRFWTASAILDAYFKALDGFDIVPTGHEERKLLLDIFLLDKAMYELDEELLNRPEWAAVPLRAIRQLLEQNKN
ncbi:maltose alpha-D-glucosyltransferase [Desulfovibrio ferrophilus]|uniref:Maltokinase n=1 Tax=Desulfovibrio ferrophilus TaxID=241368 RepID=A0A2Z6B209_9BACT|nr:maltose alpha-D-glucosyltransferase [Desulfovibrio ferrophilus]BBD09515.1 trehalose synthase [Desulfovibrio ferrophilus]